jgi:Fe-Mn family superoxide dismutase
MYKLPELPYALDALEPFISKEIMDIHYNKHHRNYLDNLNKIISTYDPTLFDAMSETTIAMYINTFPADIRQNLKNQLGGHVNHSFFWSLLSGENQTEYKKKIEPLFVEHFGSFDQAMNEFSDAAKKHFGSGWVWMTYNPISENIEIRSYQNQDSPLFENMYPLLGIDVWEHAYYLQYKSDKAAYVANFINVINWKYVYELVQSYADHDHNSCDQENSCQRGCC